MKPTRRNPLFAGFFRKNALVSAIIVSLAAGAHSQTLYWDTNGATAGSGNAGGTWNTGTNWTTSADGTTATVGWTNGNEAVFSAGTDGTGTWTVNIAGTVATPLIRLEDLGLVTLAGGTVDISGGATIDTSVLGGAGGRSITWTTAFSGAGNLNIAGHGDTSDTGGGSNTAFRLAGLSTFTGDVTITSGVVDVRSYLGNPANKIILDGGGVIDQNINIDFPYDIEVPLGSTGIYRTWGSVASGRLSGAITGGGTLRHTDGGTATITGDGSAFTGTINNARGNLTITSNDWAGTSFVNQDGTLLRFSAPGTVTIQSYNGDRDLFINSGTQLNIASGEFTVEPGAGNNNFWAQGAGSLTSSSGELVFNYTVPYTAQGDQAIRVLVEDFDGSTPLTVVKRGVGGIAQFVQQNTYSGGTIIEEGRIAADNAQAFGSGPINVQDGGQAFLSRTGAVFANNITISGDGSLENGQQLGAIRYNRNTTAGTLTLAGDARIAAATNASGTHTGALIGSNTLEINGPGTAGTINLSGNLSGFTGGVRVSAGTLNLGSNLAGTATLESQSTLNVLGGTTLGGLALDSQMAANLNVRSGGTVNGNVMTDYINGVANVSVAGQITGNVMIDDESTLRLAGGTIGGNLASGFDGSSLIDWSFAGTLGVGGNLTAQGIHRVNLQNHPTPGTPLTLLTYGGSFSGNIADFELASTTSYRGATFTHDAVAKSISVDIQSTALVWRGNINGTIDASTANWTGSDTVFHFGDSMLFDDSADLFNLTLNGIHKPSSVTFNNALGYTINGGLGHGFSGATGIVKNGPGALTLGGASSDFTGLVEVNEGVLTLANSEALGFNSGINIAAGARVVLNHAPGGFGRHYTWTIAGDGGDGPGGVGAITRTDGNVFENAGILNLILAGDAEVGGNNGRFDIGRSGGISGSINGQGNTFTKVGSNQVVVRAPSNDITYQVSAGTLIFEDFDSASGSETITVTGGSLGTWGLRTIGNDVVFSNPGGRLVSQSNIGRWTGAMTLNGNTTFDAMGTLVIDGALAGIGNITRSGGGTLVLQNTSAAFSGKITNPSGALRILEPGVLGSATGADVLTLGDGTTLQGGNAFSIGSATIGSPTQGITQTGNVTYDAGHGALLVVDSPITGTGNINKPNNSGTIRFNSSVSTTGNLNANGGGVTVTNSLNITDATNGTVLSENLNTLTFASGANANIRNLSLRTSVMNIQPGASVTTNRFVTSDGSAARSVINQTGGTFNITGSDNSNTTGRSFLLGHWGSGGTTSVYNLSGGTINSTAASMGFGWDSADVAFNQSGGTFNVLGLALDNGRNNLARFNLTGGRLNLGAAGISNASNKQVNLGGGTVGAFADWNALKPLTLTGIGGDTVFDTLDSVDGTTPRTINLTAALHGPGGFVKTGAGTLIANHPDNLIAGTARIEDGTLQLRTSAASSGDVELAGGHLQLTGAIAADHVDLGGGSVTFNVGETTSTITCNTLEVSQPTTVQLAPQGLLTLNDEFTIIDYTGTIDGLGLGGLTLTPLPSPRISLSLNEDAVNSRLIVRVDATDSLIWTGAQNMVWDGSTLNWRQASDSAPASFATFDTVRFDGASPGTVSLTGSHNAALVEVDSSSNYVFAGTGQLSGSTMVRKSGSGTLTILNANAHTGGNTIIDGTLRLGNANAAGASGAVIDVQSGGTLDLNGQDLEGANTLVTSNGIIANNSPTVAALRRLELTGDTTMNVANPIVVGAFSGADGTLNLNGHTLVKNGAGQLTVNGVSIGDGNIVVNQGVLRLIRDYNDNQRAVSITGSGSITINAGATMVTDRWAVGLTLTKPITLNGGTIGSDWPGPNGSTIASPITVAADSTMNFTGGYANVTFSGVITGPGKITRIGSETVNFTAVNSYEGGTQLTSGNLAFEAGSLGTTGDITMDGGTLVWRPGNSEDISSRVAMVFAKNANFNTGANNVTFASGIGNDANAALVKTGTGSLTLQGANSYTGNTTVNNGTFRLEAGGSMEVVLGFSGNNNRITATTTLDNDENVTASGNVQLAGTLVLDFTTADIFDGNAWVLAEAFGSAAAVNYEGTFSLNSTAGSFTRAGSVHTLVDGDNTWTFDEATGTLTLGVSSGTGYDDWALQIADVNQRRRDDDPDGDGFTNLQEFLFGTSPNEPNGSLSSAQRDGNNLIVRWLELESGATYTLLESATLDNPWITSAVVPFDDAFQTGVPAGYIRRVAEVPIGSGRNFVRIEGEEN